MRQELSLFADVRSSANRAATRDPSSSKRRAASRLAPKVWSAPNSLARAPERRTAMRLDRESLHDWHGRALSKRKYRQPLKIYHRSPFFLHARNRILLAGTARPVYLSVITPLLGATRSSSLEGILPPLLLLQVLNLLAKLCRIAIRSSLFSEFVTTHPSTSDGGSSSLLTGRWIYAGVLLASLILNPPRNRYAFLTLLIRNQGHSPRSYSLTGNLLRSFTEFHRNVGRSLVEPLLYTKRVRSRAN